MQAGPYLTPPPNIVLLVIDDLGFTDLGSFGGEINTPTLDGLASKGVRFNNFYVSPNCAPTRSMLLSGVDHHVSGHGTMHEHVAENQLGQPGYEGYLNESVTPLPRVLNDAGYATFMVGKWHLGVTEETSPAHRGFDKSFALLLGGGSHFSDQAGLVSRVPKAPYREDGKLVKQLPEGFYSTTFYTDKAISYISDHRQSGQPFFLYLAYTAAHWPLQVPDDALNLYAGKYDKGYEVLREERLARAKALGIIEQRVSEAPRADGVPAWDSLDADSRRVQAKKMEIYAAMIDIVDQNVGKLLAHLDESKLLENTVFVVMSDNGAEGNRRFRIGGDDWVEKTFDHSYEAMGREGSYVFLGPGWAQASMGPFRLWKAHTTEGGIRAPLIVSGSSVAGDGKISSSIATVRDLYPTLIEWAGLEVPTAPNRPTPQGRSLLPILRGSVEEVHPEDVVLGWEIFGGRALREGEWKLVWVAGPNGTSRWELYNLQTDPGETNDLVATHPEKVAHLLTLWEDYAKRHGVVLPVGQVHGAWGDEY
jgi:arylsulfatase